MTDVSEVRLTDELQELQLDVECLQDEASRVVLSLKESMNSAVHPHLKTMYLLSVYFLQDPGLGRVGHSGEEDFIDKCTSYFCMELAVFI